MLLLPDTHEIIQAKYEEECGMEGGFYNVFYAIREPNVPSVSR